jgi:hypothetical protein
LDKIHTVGKRTQGTNGYFLYELAVRISTRRTADAFNLYHCRGEDAFGAEVDFAQPIKLHGRGGPS